MPRAKDKKVPMAETMRRFLRKHPNFKDLPSVMEALKEQGVEVTKPTASAVFYRQKDQWKAKRRSKKRQPDALLVDPPGTDLARYLPGKSPAKEAARVALTNSGVSVDDLRTTVRTLRQMGGVEAAMDVLRSLVDEAAEVLPR